MPQNIINKSPLDSLGYQFIKPPYLPKGKNEYYLRNMQIRNGIAYRRLSAHEIEMLVRNGNTSDDWNNLLVSDAFNPELVKNCKFYGLVRIGKLEPFCLSFSDLKVPVGLYNSTIISCDFGDNVVIDNVNYLSHYIIGSEVIITNVNELVTTNHAKFGNGIIKQGEQEQGMPGQQQPPMQMPQFQDPKIQQLAQQMFGQQAQGQPSPQPQTMPQQQAPQQPMQPNQGSY